jgi:hypothetical protein
VKLHAPIPRPAQERLLRRLELPAALRGGRKKLQDDRELPEWPVFFTKAPTTVNGPYDAIPYDAASRPQLDWEVELGVIVGPGGKDIAHRRRDAPRLGLYGR